MADQSFPSMPIPLPPNRHLSGICHLVGPMLWVICQKTCAWGGAFVNVYNHFSLHFFGFNLILWLTVYTIIMNVSNCYVKHTCRISWDDFKDTSIIAILCSYMPIPELVGHLSGQQRVLVMPSFEVSVLERGVYSEPMKLLLHCTWRYPSR